MGEYIKLSFISQSAGDPWAAPDDWDALHPQLNLNLDDQTTYVLAGGPMHITTQVGGEITVLCFYCGVLHV